MTLVLMILLVWVSVSFALFSLWAVGIWLARKIIDPNTPQEGE